MPPEAKICACCGRRITWRKAWEREWESIRFCSKSCRGKRITPVDQALESATVRLLEARPRGATICPSEAAREVAGEDEALWRPLMESARSAARRLVAAGTVEIVQAGRIVDPSTARGPIRIRRVTRG